MIRKIWYFPVFSGLLMDRSTGLIIFGVGGLHLALNLVGLPGWVCPIRAATGIPCPGCGLTTAVIHLLRGHFGESLKTHAFVPVFLLVLLIMAAVLLLPPGPRQRLIEFINSLETRFGVTAWILFALFVYWGVRLIGLVSFSKAF